MGIEFLMGAVCEVCEELAVNGFEVHEVSPDHWVVFCNDCVLATGVAEGK